MVVVVMRRLKVAQISASINIDDKKSRSLGCTAVFLFMGLIAGNRGGKEQGEQKKKAMKGNNIQ